MPSYGPEVLGPPQRDPEQQFWDPEIQTMDPEKLRRPPGASAFATWCGRSSTLRSRSSRASSPRPASPRRTTSSPSTTSATSRSR